MAGAHWSDRWLGWEWVEGERECGDFVAHVLRAEFGRGVSLPRARGVRERDRFVARLAGDFARPLDRPPAEGDGVLMRALGRRGVGHHLGLWCAPAGVPSVLHAQPAIGAVRHPLDELAIRGLEVAGLYAWRPESSLEPIAPPRSSARSTPEQRSPGAGPALGKPAAIGGAYR